MAMLHLSNVSKRYGKVEALRDISLDHGEGEMFGLIGPDGSGKTTLFRLMTSLLVPDSGTLCVDGLDPVRDYRELRRHIGYMSQRFSLYDDLTVRENLTLFGGIYGMSDKTIREKSEQLLQELGFENVGDSLVSSLPLGWKQKLAFSVAIFHNPEIVFLDEPTGGVDVETRKQFWQLIYKAAERGITVFVTTHYMDEAEYCGRVSIMVDGRVEALDTPENLKAKYEKPTMYEVFLFLARKAQRS